jgi:cell division transport system permease protein
MQLVGATKAFIRKPFLIKAFWLGLSGAVLASAALYVILYYINRYLPEFHFLTDYKLLGILFSSIFAIGILITLVSTYFATSRLLNLKSEDLHF